MVPDYLFVYHCNGRGPLRCEDPRKSLKVSKKVVGVFFLSSLKKALKTVSKVYAVMAVVSFIVGFCRWGAGRYMSVERDRVESLLGRGW